ncbi:hypothetical protein PVAP13_1KG337005 [Panicum virgatum]|uniref:Uncharacterized protein n=1 Tax=Panicum virgatum TaxID=38727 RepID=A0A8T0XPC9_PANVG|nr:hypothetical protein PVAP13_1KG337005 [Panicum virgatum]
MAGVEQGGGTTRASGGRRRRLRRWRYKAGEGARGGDGARGGGELRGGATYRPGEAVERERGGGGGRRLARAPLMALDRLRVSRSGARVARTTRRLGQAMGQCCARRATQRALRSVWGWPAAKTGHAHGHARWRMRELGHRGRRWAHGGGAGVAKRRRALFASSGARAAKQWRCAGRRGELRAHACSAWGAWRGRRLAG